MTSTSIVKIALMQAGLLTHPPQQTKSDRKSKNDLSENSGGSSSSSNRHAHANRNRTHRNDVDVSSSMDNAKRDHMNRNSMNNMNNMNNIPPINEINFRMMQNNGKLLNQWMSRSELMRSYYSPHMLKILDYTHSAARSRTRARSHSASSSKAESIVSQSIGSRSPSPSLSNSLSQSNNPSDFGTNNSSSGGSSSNSSRNVFLDYNGNENNGGGNNNSNNNNGNNNNRGFPFHDYDFDLQHGSMDEIDFDFDFDNNGSDIYEWPGDYGLGSGNSNDDVGSNAGDARGAGGSSNEPGALWYITDWMAIDENSKKVSIDGSWMVNDANSNSNSNTSNNNNNTRHKHMKLTPNEWRKFFETIGKNKNDIENVEINNVILDKESNRFFESVCDAVMNHGLQLKSLKLNNIHFMDGHPYHPYDSSSTNRGNGNGNEGQQRRKRRSRRNVNGRDNSDFAYAAEAPLLYEEHTFNFSKFMSSLQACNDLESLTLSNTNLDDIFSLTDKFNDNLNSNESHLMRLISQHCVLNDIHLINCNIKNGALFVDALLKRCKSQIKCLNLTNNPLSDEDIASIEWAASRDHRSAFGRQFGAINVTNSLKSGGAKFQIKSSKIAKNKNKNNRNNNRNNRNSKNRNDRNNKKNKNRKNSNSSSFGLSSETGQELQKTAIMSVFNNEFDDFFQTLFPPNKKAIEKIEKMKKDEMKENEKDENDENDVETNEIEHNENSVCQLFIYTPRTPPRSPPGSPPSNSPPPPQGGQQPGQAQEQVYGNGITPGGPGAYDSYEPGAATGIAVNAGGAPAIMGRINRNRNNNNYGIGESHDQASSLALKLRI